MRNSKIVKLIIAFGVVVLSLATVQTTNAQEGTNSGNMVFSPYTMYGLGEFIRPGTASMMSMGGVGIGQRSTMEINYLNPASLSALHQRSAIFSFGGRGTNLYSKTPSAKTAYNTADITDLGLAVPLYRGVGLSFSLMPVSAVGFNSTVVDETSSVTEDIGRAKYQYTGEGGISQVSMGLGVMVVRGFSVGANVNYYFGNINRYHMAQIYPMLGQGTAYRSLLSSEKMHVSDVGFNFGAQYSKRVGRNSVLNFGVTYQPDLNMRVASEELKISQVSSVVDTISYQKSKSSMTMPAKIGAGVFFTSKKITAGFDWNRQDWTDAFKLQTSQNIILTKQNEYRMGISYCPNFTSMGSAFQRWTYKVGVHYTESYLQKDNTQLTDFGISAGVDIPMLKSMKTSDRGYSKISLGVDFGKRGTFKVGQVQENYFRVYAGLTLFGNDYWFFKQKFH